MNVKKKSMTDIYVFKEKERWKLERILLMLTQVNAKEIGHYLRYPISKKIINEAL